MSYRLKVLLLTCSLLVLAGCGAQQGAPKTPAAKTTPSGQAACIGQGTGQIARATGVKAGETAASFKIGQSSLLLTAIDFVSANEGFVVGDGVILATHDGGGCWTRQYSGRAKLAGVRFVDAKHGFAWGAHTILASRNGGQTFAPVSYTNNSIQAISWVDATMGYAVMETKNQGFQLFVSRDGGRTWAHQKTPVGPVAVRFVSRNDGYMTGSEGGVYRTSNGGKTWTRAYSLSPAGNPGLGFEIAAQSAQEAYVVYAGQSAMMQTPYTVVHGRGQTWKPVVKVGTAGAGPAPGAPPKTVTTGPGSSPGPLALTKSGRLYLVGECRACGTLGTVSLMTTSDGGQNWQTLGTIYGASGIPGPGDLSFPTAKDGWLVDPVNPSPSGFGGGSQIYVTHDGGHTWTQSFPASALSPLRGISFVTKAEGYGLGAVGAPTAVLKTTDGGKHWTRVGALPLTDPVAGPANGMQAIAFRSAKDGFAIGFHQSTLSGGGTLFATTDGGANWKPVSGVQNVFSVAFASPQNGCLAVSGMGESSYKTTDGGTRWTRDSASYVDCLVSFAPKSLGSALRKAQSQHTRIPWTWVGLAKSNGAVGWLPTQNGWLMSDGNKTTVHSVGGLFWYPNNGLDFVDAKDGYMLTISGQLFATSDGGRTWTQRP